MIIRTIDAVRDGTLFAGYRLVPAHDVLELLTAEDVVTEPAYAITASFDPRMSMCMPSVTSQDPLMQLNVRPMDALAAAALTRRTVVIAVFHKWRAANQAMDELMASMVPSAPQRRLRHVSGGQGYVPDENGGIPGVVDLRPYMLDGRPTAIELEAVASGRTRVVDLRTGPGDLAPPPPTGDPEQDMVARLEQDQMVVADMLRRLREQDAAAVRNAAMNVPQGFSYAGPMGSTGDPGGETGDPAGWRERVNPTGSEPSDGPLNVRSAMVARMRRNR